MSGGASVMQGDEDQQGDETQADSPYPYWNRFLERRTHDDGLLCDGLKNLLKSRKKARAAGRWVWFRGWLDISSAVFVGVFLLGLVFSLVDPFGMRAVTRAHSDRIAARLMAPFYQSKAQDRIAVIIINDKTLKELGMEWPLSYLQYAQLLREILQHKPRAVFVDIMLPGQRDYDKSYEYAEKEFAHIFGQTVPPVFFGVTAPGDKSLFTSSGVGNIAITWEGAGDNYPLVIGKAEAESMDAHRSAALALYQLGCKGKADLAAGCKELASNLGDVQQLPHMAVQWGMQKPVVSRRLADGLNNVCFTVDAIGRWGRLKDAIYLAGVSLIRGLKEDVEDKSREGCAYSRTFYWENIHHSIFYPNEEEGEEGGLLNDRIILVGTNLKGVDDTVISPVHQKLPGVYMHAMALDNLMRWGASYVRPPSRLQAAGFNFFNALVISGFTGLVLLHFRRRESRRGFWPGWHCRFSS